MHTAHEALADHRAHRATHEIELKTSGHDRQRANRTADNDQRVGFARVFHRLLQALRILSAVAKLQRVDRQNLLSDFIAAFSIEQRIEPRAGADAHVLAALRAYKQSFLQLGRVQHRFAARALGPQAFRHGLARSAFFALDARRQNFVDPAHKFSLGGPHNLRVVDRDSHTADESFDDLHYAIAGDPFHFVNDARSDNDCIGHLRHCLRVFGVANAKTDRHR